MVQKITTNVPKRKPVKRSIATPHIQTYCTDFSKSSPAISFIASTVWNMAIRSGSLPAWVTLTSTTAMPSAVPAIFTLSRKRLHRLLHVSSENKGIRRQTVEKK
eukprot:GGOE01055107.1.p2 GENE.GGOE01055107.1~~GGOE01055107.1.p2  ORF type:complete len:104 (-),score=7.48 GGOE01055107.1:2-313(-)